jgi:hypothetical protein
MFTNSMLSVNYLIQYCIGKIIVPDDNVFDAIFSRMFIRAQLKASVNRHVRKTISSEKS